MSTRTDDDLTSAVLAGSALHAPRIGGVMVLDRLRPGSVLAGGRPAAIVLRPLAHRSRAPLCVLLKEVVTRSKRRSLTDLGLRRVPAADIHICIPAAEIRRKEFTCLPLFFIIVNMEELSFAQLRLEDQFLLNEAEKGLKGGYGPYSKFHVGCSVRTSSEKVYLGANMDNASFGMTICAERAALGAANTYQDRNVMAMAVIGKLAGGESPVPTFPCGACRQLIYEFASLADHDILIFCSNTRKDRIVVTSIHELLPKAFGPRDLGVDVSRYATP